MKYTKEIRKKIYAFVLILSVFMATLADSVALCAFAADEQAGIVGEMSETSIREIAMDDTTEREDLYVSEDRPFEDTPANEGTSEDMSAEDKPAEDTPAENGPSENVPAENEPSEDTPVEDKSSEEMPAEDVSPEEMPAEDVSPEDTPAEDVSSEEMAEEEISETVSENSIGDAIMSESLLIDESEEDGDPQSGRAQGYIDSGFYDDDSYEMGGDSFDMVGTYTHNERFANYEIKKGIDVSRHNGVIDWSKVRADGIEFAFIRIGFRGYGSTGSLNMDDKYTQNISNAIKNGIKVGVYIFSQAISPAEAEAEAKYVLKNLGGYNLSLPIVLDYEFYSSASGESGRLYDAVRSGKLNRDSMTTICNTFCKTISAAGYQAAVYGNKYMFSTYLYPEKISNNYKIWLANYTSKTNYSGVYSFWQCSSKERVNGISGDVDFDFWYVGPKTYTISYKGNGSTSGSMTAQKGLLPGESVTLKTNTFKKKGYQFLGWNTAADGSGTYYLDATTIDSLSEVGGVTIPLYAQWGIEQYSIQYELNYDGGYDDAKNPTSYDIATPSFTLKNPTRTGYTFKGWYTSLSYKKRITKINKGSIGNRILYAKWAANKYTILFKGNGSTSGQMKSQSCKYDWIYTLRPVSFKKKGYEFLFWSTTPDGGAAYYDKAEICNLFDTNGSKLTLYAQWSRVDYSISYELNGGYFENGAVSTFNVETPTFNLDTPVRDGYTFKGWYTSANFKKKVTKIKKGTVNNRVFYAKWVEI